MEWRLSDAAGRLPLKHAANRARVMMIRRLMTQSQPTALVVPDPQ